jgi:hypothetical protein
MGEKYSLVSFLIFKGGTSLTAMNPFIVPLMLITSVASAAIYDVGPGYTKTRLRDVVWDQLQPGDIVNIHTTPGGYHETIAITQSGTAAQHIIIRGIPDAQGNLPVIDGAGAVVDPNIHLYYSSLVGLGAIIISLNNHTSYGVSPSYIDIESLEVRNAHMGNTYTNGGTTFTYSKFTSGIYIEHSHFMAIRGCNLHHNGLGLFANSKYGTLGTSTQNILVEHNWIHENGNVGSSSEHGIYVESVGAVYQYNIIGPQLAGAFATGIKDRSSGCVVRYNTFINSGGSNSNGYMIMLVDPAYPLGYSRPDYRQTFMYGNTFTNPGVTPLILYGGDQPNYSHYRQGTLYFYHNTVVTVADSTPYNYSVIIDLPRKVASGGAAITETIDARNNIFASLPLTPGGTGAKTYLMETDMPGTLNLGTNWCSPNTLLSTSAPASVTGAAGILYGNASGVNNPAFLNASMLDYRLATGARSIDVAGPLSPAVTNNTLGGDFTPTEEIGPAQASHARAAIGTALDLGAFESDGSTTAAAAGALGFAYSTYGQVYYENSGVITFTVSRLGGSAGAVDLDYTSVDESATAAGADFTAASGTLHWAAGDATTKSFTVTVLPDSITEAAETFGVRLSNPTNGALLGASAYIQNQVRDGSSGGGGSPAGGALAFSTTAFVASESVGATGTVITVSRTGGTTGAVSVHYATSNGSASAADYTSTSGTLNWAAGDSTAQSFTVAINDDVLAEINETIVLSLTSPAGGAALGNPVTATLTINDNDHTPAPPQELIYAVGSTSGSLIAFYSDAPHSPLITVPITGLPANEIVRGIDFDPLTGRLYAVVINLGLPVTANHLYTIDPLTGVATIVNATSFTPLLVHPSIDLGFNPVTGDLNIAVGTGQQNIRLNPLTGDVIGSDTPFAFAAGDPNAGATPSIVGADFQNLNNGTATYYGIDQTLDVLVRIGSDGGSPNAGTTGLLTTLGPLGVDTSGVTGLDFSRTSGGAFACMGGPGATTGDLYYLDTTTGAATLIGQIALPEAVRDIAVAPPYLAWKHTHFAGNVQVSSIAGDAANPAHDGIANLLKYAFGMDPATNSRMGLPLTGFVGGKLRLGFNRTASDVHYQVQASDDLTNWMPAITTDVTPLGSPAGWIEVEDSIGSTNSTRHFLRLQVLP